MALSDSKDYTSSVTAANIIALALRRLGVLDPGESIDSTEESNALVTLNLMIKEWAAIYSLDNWLRQHSVVWLTSPGSKYIYSLGPSGDNAAYEWAETELASDAAASASTVEVEAVNSTHTIDTANIGIHLDDGDIHFTTINGAPSSTTVTLTDALPSAASSGNRVYTYTTGSQISRPRRLISAQRITHDKDNVSGLWNTIGGNEAEVRIIGQREYDILSRKTQTGPPISVYYEPTRTNGNLYVWPTGTTGLDFDKILLTYNIYPDDFDATSNNAEIPPEWHNALAWGLAGEMASEYGISAGEIQYFEAKAQHKIRELQAHDVENASVQFAVDSHP